MTDKGQVCLIVFNNSGDEGEENLSYQVRHGVRTVATFTGKGHAQALARALVSESEKEPEPEAESETVDSAAPDLEPAGQTVTRAGRSR